MIGFFGTVTVLGKFSFNDISQSQNIRVVTPTAITNTSVSPTSQTQSFFLPGTEWYGKLGLSDGTTNRIDLKVNSMTADTFSGVLTSPKFGTSIEVTGTVGQEIEKFSEVDKQRLKYAIIPDGAVLLGYYIMFQVEKSVKGIPAGAYYLTAISTRDLDREFQGNFYYLDNKTYQYDGFFGTDKKLKGTV